MKKIRTILLYRGGGSLTIFVRDNYGVVMNGLLYNDFILIDSKGNNIDIYYARQEDHGVYVISYDHRKEVHSLRIKKYRFSTKFKRMKL